MFSKIFARGAGRASGIDYLLNHKDAEGKDRNPPAELLRGNPELTKAIIAGLNFAQNYKSGVLSFTETVETIGTDKLQQIMDSFEAMVKVGFEDDPGRIDMLWVLHQDKGRAELHWVTPNVDLETGKRFQPYYDRVDQKMFRTWERLTNAENGFTDPSDPTRARTINIPPYLPQNKAEQYRAINEAIGGLFAQGEIQNRTDVVETLTTAGYTINRISRDYLSIRDTNGLKLRLKGAFYGESFTSPSSLASETEASRRDEPDRLERLRTELESHLDRRRAYVQKRYCQSIPDSFRGEPSISTTTNPPLQTSPNTNQRLPESTTYQVRAIQHQDPSIRQISIPTGTGDRGNIFDDWRFDPNLVVESYITPGTSPNRKTATRKQRPATKDRRTPTENQTVETQTEEITADDRARDTLIEILRTTDRSKSATASAFDRTISHLSQEIDHLDRANQQLNSSTTGLPILREHLQKSERAAREISQRVQTTTAATRQTTAELNNLTATSDSTRTAIIANQQRDPEILRQLQEIQQLAETNARIALEREQQELAKSEAAEKARTEAAAREAARPKPPEREYHRGGGGMSL